MEIRDAINTPKMYNRIDRQTNWDSGYRILSSPCHTAIWEHICWIPTQYLSNLKKIKHCSNSISCFSLQNASARLRCIHFTFMFDVRTLLAGCHHWKTSQTLREQTPTRPSDWTLANKPFLHSVSTTMHPQSKQWRLSTIYWSISCSKKCGQNT